MVDNPVRLYLYAAALLALIGLGWYGVHIYNKAQRVDVAEAKAEAAEQRALDIAEAATKAAAKDMAINATLEAFRADLGSQSQSFRDALLRKPLVHEVTREVNGVPVTCRERDPASYRELFNQAVTGVTSP
jgi:hypothetical protein